MAVTSEQMESLRASLEEVGPKQLSELIFCNLDPRDIPGTCEELGIALPEGFAPPRPPLLAHFYLVSSGDHEGGHYCWKWGITTKDTAKQRSSDYFDVHRWVDIPDMRVGRRIEKLMGCLAVCVLNERNKRCMYDEFVPHKDIPLDVLAEMVDWAIDQVDDRGNWSDATEGLYQAACPDSFARDDAPPIALRFRAMKEEGLRPVERKVLEPMWA